MLHLVGCNLELKFNFTYSGENHMKLRGLHLHKNDCQVCLHSFKLQLLASSLLSVRMEQLGSHWTGFHRI